jgi:putative Holliday junction resolvase
MGRILAVDPGEARIGLAVSDPTRTIARPLKILPHRSRADDARAIVDQATELGVDVILVGLALDRDGRPGPQARKALRLVEALRAAADIAVETWDETGTTERARQLAGGDARHVDGHAAAVLLQEYLDAQV